MSDSVEVLDTSTGIDATTRRLRYRGRTFDVTVRTAPDNSPAAWWWSIAELTLAAGGAVARRDDWPLVDVTYPDPDAAYAAALDALRTSAPR